MFETLRMYFQYPFVRYALIVGVLIALCSSLLGVTLVLKRFSFIGDGLSHVAFGAMAPGTDIVWSGNYRTTDSRYNVVGVGDEMAEVFTAAGISVLHDRTLYDYSSYNDAYNNALAAIETYLAEYPSIRFILDVHRDAIGDAEGNQYKVISEIDGVGTSAQMTLVMGSDGSGLAHEHWMENLKLAVALQDNILQSYPTLMRPILLRNSRYNQHATTGSLLVDSPR